jgi:hypothetical protein
VELANWPGAEVLEAPAFAAFLPRLCEVLCHEEPILPNIATWWCGQPDEAAYVRDQLGEMVIASAFGRRSKGFRPDARCPAGRCCRKPAVPRCSMPWRAARSIIAAGNRAAGNDPGNCRGTVRAARLTLRAFVVRGSDGEWTVMPGGFARLSSSDEVQTGWMGEGDMSADVCIVDDAPPAVPMPTRMTETPRVRRGGGILASQAADNLFWFARYVERAEITLRVIRAVLGSTIEVDLAAGSNPETVAALLDLLVEWGRSCLRPPVFLLHRQRVRLCRKRAFWAGSVRSLSSSARPV